MDIYKKLLLLSAISILTVLAVGAIQMESSSDSDRNSVSAVAGFDWEAGNWETTPDGLYKFQKSATDDKRLRFDYHVKSADGNVKFSYKVELGTDARLVESIKGLTVEAGSEKDCPVILQSEVSGNNMGMNELNPQTKIEDTAFNAGGTLERYNETYLLGEQWYMNLSTVNTDVAENKILGMNGAIVKVAKGIFLEIKNTKVAWYPDETTTLSNISKNKFAGSELKVISITKVLNTELQNAGIPGSGIKVLVSPESYVLMNSMKKPQVVPLNECSTDAGVKSRPWYKTSAGEHLYVGDREVLTTVTVPDGVTKIGDYSFKNCARLTDVTIPSGIVSIGEGVFEGCTALSTVTMPNSMSNISNRAFYGCSSIVTLNFAAGGTADLIIGTSAFEKCSKIKTIELPVRTSEVLVKAFADCTELTAFTFASGNAEDYRLTVLNCSAFQGCNKLGSLSFPVTKELKLTSTYALPKGLTSISVVGDGLNQDGVIYKKTAEGGYEILITVPNISGVVAIKSGVKEIPANMFSGRGSLGSVIIPNTVTAIGSGAFNNCKKLQSVIFEADSKLKEIGENAFAESAIREIEFPASLESIGKKAFVRSYLLERVVFKSTDLKLGDPLQYDDGVFRDCSELSTVTFKDTMVRLDIGAGSFRGCDNLVTLTLPEGTKSIGAKAFEGTKMTRISIPSTVDNIDVRFVPLWGQGGEGPQLQPFANGISDIVVHSGNVKYFVKDGMLFEKLAGGKSALLYIPQNVTQVTLSDVSVIKESVFKAHPNLESVDFGIGFESDIRKYEFSGCSSLKNVTFGDGSTMKKIGTGAFESTALQRIVIPDSVTALGAYSFKGCTDLLEVVISENSGLTRIGTQAFMGCVNLKSVILPKGVDQIGCGAYKGFEEGEQGYKPWGADKGNVFSGCVRLLTIDIRQGGNASYRVDDQRMLVKLDKGGNELEYVVSGMKDKNTGKNTVQIRADVAKVTWHAFKDALLDAVSVQDGSSTYSSDGSILMDKDQTSVIYIPSGVSKVALSATVTVIKDGVLNNSSSLRELSWTGTSIVINGGSTALSVLKLKSTGDVTIRSIVANNLKTVEIECGGKLELNRIIGVSEYALKITADTLNASNALGDNLGELTLNVSGFTDIGSLFRGGTYGSVKITLNTVPSDSAVKSITGTDVVIQSTIPGFTPKIESVHKNPNWIMFSFTTTEGLGACDVQLDSTEATVVGNMFKVNISGASVTINVTEKAASGTNHTVSFDLRGGSFTGTPGVLSVDSGRSIKISEMKERAPLRDGYAFKGWYLDSRLFQEYDRNTAVTKDMTLYAKWDPTNGYAVAFESMNGLVTAVDGNGTMFRSGDKVSSGTVLTFRFAQSAGAELKGWMYSMGGVRTSSPEKDLALTITGAANVGPEIRCYATSNSLISVTGLKTPTAEDIIQIWENKYNINTEGMTWTGFPSVPVIAGDFVFVRAANDLTKLDINTGVILEKVSTSNSTVSAFYHYLGYGDGMIIDYSTGNVYDLDLNVKYSMKKSLPHLSAAFYNDGHFYGLCDGKLFKFEARTGVLTTDGAWNGGVAVDWHGIYGTTSAPVFANGHIYFIEIVGDSREKRAIGGVDLNIGSKVQIVLLKMDDKLLDDGWLTYYAHGGSGYLFVTGYETGIFDSVSGKTSIIDSVKLNGDGTFVVGSERWIDLRNPGTASAFVVVDGRGYVNVSGTKDVTSGSGASAVLYVVDADRFLTDSGAKTFDEWKQNRSDFVIYKEDSVQSHGSIVVSTAYYDAAKKAGDIHIYLLPYSSGDQALYIFTDKAGKTEPGRYFKTSPVGENFGSQAIRVGSSGQIVWYTDSGAMYCYAGASTTRDYSFFTQTGQVAEMKNGSGNTIEEALNSAFKDTGATVDTVKNTVTIGGTVYNAYYYDPISKTVSGAVPIKSIDDKISKYRIFFLSDSVKGQENVDSDAVWNRSTAEGSQRNTLLDILKYPGEFGGMKFYGYAVMTVSYDVNMAGVDAIAPVICSEGTIIDLVDLGKSSQQTEYEFKGWSDGNKLYSVQDLKYIAGDRNVTLTAIWSSKTCPITVIKIIDGSKTLEIGKTVTVPAIEVLPGNASNKDVIWSSDRPDVAKLILDAKGKATHIQSVSEGIAKITVTSKDSGVSVTCTITVIPVPVKDLRFDTATATVKVGDVLGLSARLTIGPASASDKTVTWSSSNESVAMVDQDGGVTAVSAGVAVITARSSGGLEAKIALDVQKAGATGVVLSRSSVTTDVGKTVMLSVTVSPAGIADKTVIWSSSNESVATVDQDGMVRAVSPGTSTITVKTVSGGKTATCDVTVNGKVTGISLNESSRLIEVGDAVSLEAMTQPSAGSSVTWSSSNESVATVDRNGTVTGISAGTVTIKVTANGNAEVSASCTVVVAKSDKGTESSETNSDGSTTDTRTETSDLGDGMSMHKETVTTKDKDGGKLSETVRVVVTDPETGVRTEVTSVTDASGNTSVTARTSVPASETVSDGKQVITVKDSSIEKAVSGMAATGAVVGKDVTQFVEAEVHSEDSEDVLVNLSSESVRKMAEASSTGFRIVNDAGPSMSITNEVMKTLSAEGGNVSFGMGVVEKNRLSEAQKSVVGDKKVYEFTMSAGGKSVTKLGGIVTVTLPYSLGKGEDVNNLSVFCLSSNGSIEEFKCVYDAEKKSVMFETTHFSKFYVGSGSGSSASDGSSTGLLLAVGVVIAVLLAMIVVMMLRTEMRCRNQNQ